MSDVMVVRIILSPMIASVPMVAQSSDLRPKACHRKW
jgi:hypothetical protein